MTATPSPTNWAGNVRFRARRAHRPSTVDEVRRIVAGSRRLRVLGTGHSFNAIADTTGDLLSVAGLPETVDIDPDRSIVGVPAGMRYGDLAVGLHRAGYALANLGSLPHIGIAGAVATGTHGSGLGIGGLATAVAGIDLVTAGGDLLHLDRTDPRFPGCVVALGSLGVVVRLDLDVLPTFQLRQYVYDGLPRAAAEEHLDEIFAGGYSVSLFTDWREPRFTQVWRKMPADDPAAADPPRRWWDATLADGPRHPVPGMPADTSTSQLGAPGPWHRRLPHFRPEFTPSAGDELQSEYLLPRAHAVAALRALDPLAGRIAAVLHICELRTVAADELWLSPCQGRDSVAVHFTWLPDAPAVAAVLTDIERALAPYAARPHWGKVFRTGREELRGRYPHWDDFAALRAEFDPDGMFVNDFVARYFPR